MPHPFIIFKVSDTYVLYLKIVLQYFWCNKDQQLGLGLSYARPFEKETNIW